MNTFLISSRLKQIQGIFASLTVAIAFTACSNSANNTAADSDSTPTDTVTTANTSSYQPFVIYGVDMGSDAIKNGDFIWMGDLPTSDRPDDSFEGLTLPIIKAVITGHKSVIAILAPDATTYIIDGKDSTRDALDTLDADSIQRMTIDGTTLIVETRYSLDEPNPDVKIAVDEEGRRYRRTMQK